MTDNDASILQSTVEHLQILGAEVDVYNDGEEFDAKRYNALFHMSRTPATLQRLQEIEKRTPVTNTAKAVRNCSRKEQITALQRAGIMQPPFSFHSTTTNNLHTSQPVWLKRCDGWSCHANDVCYADCANELQKAMNNFCSRGIKEVACCHHIAGDIVKFYGVENNFFHFSYPNPEKTKFGLEKINGPAQHYPFDTTQLKTIAFAAARSIGVEIFGGDCIVTKEGDIYIIDINDFPAFSCCRNEAAKAIAQLIYSKVKP